MKILLSNQIFGLVAPRIEALDLPVELLCFDQEAKIEGDPTDAEVLFRWWLSPEKLQLLLDRAPNLRWMHTSSAGVDTIISPELVQRKITLTNAAGIHAIPIAEFVLMLMLSYTKRAGALFQAAAERAWPRNEVLDVQELYGKTVLIVGLGQIGHAIAERANGFGMRVWGSRRRPAPMDGIERVVGADGWRELLPEADFVVIAAPLTPETNGMFDQAAFAQMKSSAYLINIARGQIVDTDALLHALHAGQLAGAGLDTLPEEPLPADHPLWQEPNVWITPHISWASPRTRERTADLFVENVRRFVAGEPLLNVVDYTAGY